MAKDKSVEEKSKEKELSTESEQIASTVDTSTMTENEMLHFANLTSRGKTLKEARDIISKMKK